MRLTNKMGIAYEVEDFSNCYEAVDKLGQYEDIDENPEHLAKVSKALEIIKPLVRLTKEYNYCWLWVGMNGVPITQEQYDSLKEVLL